MFSEIAGFARTLSWQTHETCRLVWYPNVLKTGISSQGTKELLTSPHVLFPLCLFVMSGTVLALSHQQPSLTSALEPPTHSPLFLKTEDRSSKIMHGVDHQIVCLCKSFLHHPSLPISPSTMQLLPPSASVFSHDPLGFGDSSPQMPSSRGWRSPIKIF